MIYGLWGECIDACFEGDNESVPKIVSNYTHADKQTTDYYNPSAHAHMH